jgi:hypothetical protein
MTKSEDTKVCRECKKNYTEETINGETRILAEAQSWPEWYCCDICEKSAAEKNYEYQNRYSTQGQYQAAWESNKTFFGH